MNILFTSAGRRVALVQLFQTALDELGVEGRIITADLSIDVAARFAADDHVIVPPVTDPAYVETLLAVCRERDIRLVVPLIDTELHLLAPHRERFAAEDVCLLVSSPEATDLTFDKRRLSAFFEVNGILTPPLLDLDQVRNDPALLPVIVKPVTGSGSVGVFRADTPREVEFFADYVPNAIIQPLIRGSEYTLDVLVDRHGAVRCVVPRKRLAVRAGEMSKGVTERQPAMTDATCRLIQALPGPFGPYTIQCFLTEEREITFIEINPRFGGGFPLSAAAGADFPKWIVEWALGREPHIPFDAWRAGLMMLRYDAGYLVDHGGSDDAPRL